MRKCKVRHYLTTVHKRSHLVNDTKILPKITESFLYSQKDMCKNAIATVQKVKKKDFIVNCIQMFVFFK